MSVPRNPPVLVENKLLYIAIVKEPPLKIPFLLKVLHVRVVRDRRANVLVECLKMLVPERERLISPLPCKRGNLI